MYDEVEYSVDWHSKFKKAIILGLVGLGISLILKNNNIKPVDNYLEDNLNTMLKVAQNYYQTNETTTKITLQEMLDKKMLLEFVDDEGNYCDTHNSYAIKENNKVEVYLKCSNEPIKEKAINM